ncbi:MAG: phenylacetate--CoA ligase family protein [Kiloniellaceae bacterium]
MTRYRYTPTLSAVESIAWPGLLPPNGRRLQGLLWQLLESEWLPPEAVRRNQYAQASRLATHAAQRVPYYRERLAAAGIPLNRVLTPEQWRRIPLLKREDIQDQGDALASRPPPADHGEAAAVSTSGSTGKPVTVLSTGVAQLMWSAISLRDHLWHGRDLSLKFAAIRKIKGHNTRERRTRDLDTWGAPVNTVFHSGPGTLLSINTAIEEQLKWLQEEQPAYLLSYPTSLMELIDLCRRSGARVPGLRQVRTMAEIVTPELRRQCREVLGVGIADMYSAQECGYFALQCPGHDHYLVQAESVLLEVIDEAGAPCRPGETGRVVVTPLMNFAMPLLRYEIGDYATVGGASPCGRGLPVLERILGRVRNMLVRPDGGKVWPAFGTKTLMKVAPVRQYQFVQQRRDLVEARIVLWRPATAAEEQALIQHVRDSLPAGIEVALRIVDTIPRSEGGKYEDFVCNLRD